MPRHPRSHRPRRTSRPCLRPLRRQHPPRQRLRRFHQQKVVHHIRDIRLAQAELRAVKTGTTRTTITTVAVAPTSIAPAAGKRSREELARIRTWARDNGHQVGVAGIIKASIVTAYDAAHPAGTLSKAS